MARSGARRSSQTPVRKAPRPRERARSTPTRTEYSAIEGDMFFPKLRRQAKWVFVFLALSFAVGFVVFGVGSDGGAGLGDLLQGWQRRHERTIRQRRAEEDRQGQPRRVQGAGRRLSAGRKPRPGDRGRRAVPEGAAEGLRVHAQRSPATTRVGRARQRDQAHGDPGSGDVEHGRRDVRASREHAARPRARTGQDRPGADDRGQPEADPALLGPPGLVRARDAALPAGGRATRRTTSCSSSCSRTPRTSRGTTRWRSRPTAASSSSRPAAARPRRHASRSSS